MLDDDFITVEEDEKMPREHYMHLFNSVGAAIEVYNELGRGMEEAIYQESLEKELSKRDIPFVSQQPLHAWYKGECLKKEYFADIVTYNDVIIELKSVDRIISDHRAQLFNYLRITKQKCGLIVNYGEKFFYSERYWYIKRYDDYFMLRKENLDKFVSPK